MYTPLRQPERLVPKYERDLGAASRTWWSWGRKRRSTDDHAAFALDSTTEEKKLVLSKNIFSLLTWHLSTIISCLATGVILYLNFSEYSIGTEIGRNHQETKNILSALQLAAKAHEILIIISIGRIARQWIQQCLINDGLLLGLVGAESSLSNLSLLVSREFRVAVGCALTSLCGLNKGQHAQARPRHAKSLILLLGFLSIGCLVCALAGPASAVLMIPRYDWFHEVDIFNGSEYYNPADSRDMTDGFDRIEGTASYPNIFIAPELDKSGAVTDRSIFSQIPKYWESALHMRKPRTHASFEYYFMDVIRVRVNANTSLNRELVPRASWAGSTKLTGVMFWETYRNVIRLSGYEPVSRNRGSEVKYVAEVAGIEVNTVCRRQRKWSCSHGNGGIGDSSIWCFLSVMENSPSGLLLSSQDLLLVYGSSNSTDVRIWMTGGWMASKDKFSDSIIVVIEVLDTQPPNPPIIVCSISATLKSVTASSNTQLFSPNELDFHEYISYFDGNSTKYDSPRKILYHESWLESIHGQRSRTSDPCHYKPNKTYPCRGRMEQTRNRLLEIWGMAIATAEGYNNVFPWWERSETPIGAETAETIVGGLFLSALLNIAPSTSQYATKNIIGPSSPPNELMVEPTRDYTKYLAPPVKVYRRIYGFRLSSRTSILSVVVLLLHAVLVLIGSLWQFRRGILIQAWGSMPEYVTLCLGSDAARGVENACAGIGRDETLNKIVKIREVTDAHLELVVVSPDTKSLGSAVDPEKKYGFLGGEGRQIKQKVE